MRNSAVSKWIPAFAGMTYTHMARLSFPQKRESRKKAPFLDVIRYDFLGENF